MLPYSPLHHLLLAGVGRPLVMTSGNLSDEPIAHDDDDAVDPARPAGRRAAHPRPADPHPLRRLGRCGSRPARLQVLRRSRGYAPEPLPLPFRRAGPVLAVGAELKSTVGVAKGTAGRRQPPHRRPRAPGHLPLVPPGRRPPVRASTASTPEVVAHDLHPEYLSTKFAAELDLPTVAVQHHHAHVAACLVEHGRTEPGARRRLRRPGLRARRHAVGRRAAGRRPRGFERVGHLRAGARCPAASRRSASRGAWRWRGRPRRRAGARRARSAASTSDAPTPSLDLADRGHRPGDHQRRAAVRRRRRAARRRGRG